MKRIAVALEKIALEKHFHISAFRFSYKDGSRGYLETTASDLHNEYWVKLILENSRLVTGRVKTIVVIIYFFLPL